MVRVKEEEGGRRETVSEGRKEGGDRETKQKRGGEVREESAETGLCILERKCNPISSQSDLYLDVFGFHWHCLNYPQQKITCSMNTQ